MDKRGSELKGRADVISKSFACELTISIKERTRIARQLLPFVVNVLKAEGDQVAREDAEIAAQCSHSGLKEPYTGSCCGMWISAAILRHRKLT